MFRGATTGKVGSPCRIERIGRPTNLDVTRNRDRRCAEDSQATDTAVSPNCLPRKVPRPLSVGPEVSPPDPSCSFGGMPAQRPPPEQLPDV